MSFFWLQIFQTKILHNLLKITPGRAAEISSINGVYIFRISLEYWVLKLDRFPRGEAAVNINILEIYTKVMSPFFCEKLPIYSSSIMAVQRTPEIKITSRAVDHLATTTSTEASRRRAAIIAPPSPKSGTTCCSRQSGSRRAKAP